MMEYIDNVLRALGVIYIINIGVYYVFLRKKFRLYTKIDSEKNNAQ